MDVLKELEIFNQEIQEAKSVVEDLKTKRIEWCRLNKEEIKKLYPKKGKIYQIVDIGSAFQYSYYLDRLNDEVYFFKVLNIAFTPHRDFQYDYGRERPTVKGVVLDCNLNEVYAQDRIYITNLKEVNNSSTLKKLQSDFTKVYVMIDKNTGYYKIGRSTNPEKRERTLQSEKPTIEMLFNHDARVVDEKHLHNMFVDKRVRGEWFDLNGSDLNKIRTYFHSS